VQTIQTLSQAVNDHFAKKGKFTDVTGLLDPTAAEKLNFENVLLGQGLIEKSPVLKIGSLLTTIIKRPAIIVDAGLVTTGPTAASADAVTAAYDLDNDATSPNPLNDAGGAQWVLALEIRDVAAGDAKLLNDKIDGVGEPFPAGALEAFDAKGRVKYITPASGITTVRVYLAHR
ncbi:MAG: hypothetical protein AAB676_13035, partial [Verrucomicrobiota bacterium]